MLPLQYDEVAQVCQFLCVDDVEALYLALRGDARYRELAEWILTLPVHIKLCVNEVPVRAVVRQMERFKRINLELVVTCRRHNGIYAEVLAQHWDSVVSVTYDSDVDDYWELPEPYRELVTKLSVSVSWESVPRPELPFPNATELTIKPRDISHPHTLSFDRLPRLRVFKVDDDESTDGLNLYVPETVEELSVSGCRPHFLNNQFPSLKSLTFDGVSDEIKWAEGTTSESFPSLEELVWQWNEDVLANTLSLVGDNLKVIYAEEEIPEIPEGCECVTTEWGMHPVSSDAIRHLTVSKECDLPWPAALETLDARSWRPPYPGTLHKITVRDHLPESFAMPPSVRDFEVCGNVGTGFFRSGLDNLTKLFMRGEGETVHVCFKALHLRELHIENYVVDAFDVVLPALEDLRLEKCRLSTLEVPPSVSRLDISSNEFTSLPVTAANTSLETLIATYCSLGPQVRVEAPSLKSLLLYGNVVEELWVPAGISELKVDATHLTRVNYIGGPDEPGVIWCPGKEVVVNSGRVYKYPPETRSLHLWVMDEGEGDVDMSAFSFPPLDEATINFGRLCPEPIFWLKECHIRYLTVEVTTWPTRCRPWCIPQSAEAVFVNISMSAETTDDDLAERYPESVPGDRTGNYAMAWLTFSATPTQMRQFNLEQAGTHCDQWTWESIGGREAHPRLTVINGDVVGKDKSYDFRTTCW
ncbi:hypothetical protein DICA2_D18756 [Diutina catenulata]